MKAQFKMSVKVLPLLALTVGVFLNLSAQAAELKPGDAAPQFKLSTQAGKDFDLVSRKGKWSVLYFYPKADTPGCTKQACAFRDSINAIREQGAEVYGISVNSVSEQKQFHDKHNLNFELLADQEAKVTELYGAKMPMVKMSKRWTFILDPELKVRAIEKDVDPVKDAQRVAEKLKSLK